MSVFLKVKQIAHDTVKNGFFFFFRPPKSCCHANERLKCIKSTHLKSALFTSFFFFFFAEIINLFKMDKSDNSRLNNVNDYEMGVTDTSVFVLVFAL